MTKIKEIELEAKDKIKKEQTEYALDMVQDSLSEIKEAKEELQSLEKEHEKLLDTNVEDIKVPSKKSKRDRIFSCGSMLL